MINIEKANIEFDKYVSQFNPNNGRIKLKIEHIKRVAMMSKKIAQNLKLSDEQVRLAELIGLFHDLGRFKQAELFNTFNDKIAGNHAELSIKVLFDEDLIDKFDIQEQHKEIIKFAILNHNKDRIEECIDNDQELFAKIIRDADKLDIFYTICEYDFQSIFWYSDFNCGPINELIIDNFINNHYIDYSCIKSNSDQIPIFYAYIFDLNFDFSIKFLTQEKYLKKFTERVYNEFSNDLVKKQVKKIYEISSDFLDKYSC